MTRNKKTTIVLLLIFFAALVVLLGSYIFQTITINKIEDPLDSADAGNHIVVLGSYENQFFLQQVWEGAQNISDEYDSVVEFYVPDSLAEDQSLNALFDYASFVNADGIIAYISSPSEFVQNVININNQEIPIVTTGTFAPNTQQISYVGTSYWELGQVFAEEIDSTLNGSGRAFILCSAPISNPNFSNFTNSIQSLLVRNPNISFVFIDQLSDDFIEKNDLKNPEKNTVIACLTEEDSLKFAQYSTEYSLNRWKQLRVIGFGSNANSEFYLSKGILDELISLDPKKIGEVALKELFEYKKNGYANSYIAADIKIMKAAE